MQADGRWMAVMDGKKVLFCKSETAGRQSARGRTPHRSISPLLAASIQINCISERTGELERGRERERDGPTARLVLLWGNHLKFYLPCGSWFPV